MTFSRILVVSLTEGAGSPQLVSCRGLTFAKYSRVSPICFSLTPSLPAFSPYFLLQAPTLFPPPSPIRPHLSNSPRKILQRRVSNSFDAPPSILYVQLQLYMESCVYRRKCYTSTALQLQQQQSSKLYTKKVISSRLVSRFITPIKLQDVWFLMCGKACTIITDRRKNHYSHHSRARSLTQSHTHTIDEYHTCCY